ncbi:MAG: M14 family zinc carboxypeptidase, partial [Candidatus Cloacimonadales bacterium]
MADFATEMAEAIPRINSAGTYQAIQSVDFGYTCQGTMGDWGYAQERIFSFTIELADQFIPPEVEQICLDNLEAALIFIRRTTVASLTGNVTNTFGDPLRAEIFVTGIDDQENMSEVEPARCDETFGRYFRPLLPGNYTVTFSFPDYLPQVYTDIQISEDELTQLDIVLKKEYVENPSIEIIDNELVLSFEEEDGYDYIVYQSVEPDNSFQVVDSGVWLDSHTWKNTISSDKMFYKIKRELQE